MPIGYRQVNPKLWRTFTALSGYTQKGLPSSGGTPWLWSVPKDTQAGISPSQKQQLETELPVSSFKPNSLGYPASTCSGVDQNIHFLGEGASRKAEDLLTPGT